MDTDKLSDNLEKILSSMIQEKTVAKEAASEKGTPVESHAIAINTLTSLKGTVEKARAAGDDDILNKIVMAIEGVTKHVAANIKIKRTEAEAKIQKRVSLISPSSGALSGIAAGISMLGTSAAVVGTTEHIVHIALNSLTHGAGATLENFKGEWIGEAAGSVTNLEAVGVALAGVGVVFSAVSFAYLVASKTATKTELFLEGTKLALSVITFGATIGLAVTTGAAHAALATVGAVIGLVSAAFQAGFAIYKAHAAFAEGTVEGTARGVVLVVAAAAFIGSLVFGIMTAAAGAAASGVGILIGIGLAILGGLLLFVAALMPTAPVLDKPNCCDDVTLIQHAIQIGYLHPKIWFSMHQSMKMSRPVFDRIESMNKEIVCLSRANNPKNLLDIIEHGHSGKSIIGEAGSSLCLGSKALKDAMLLLFSVRTEFEGFAGRHASTHHTTAYWVMDET